MSFVKKSQEYIAYGDVVVAYSGFKSMNIMIVEPGKQTQIKYGAIKHDELVRHKYKFGSKYKTARGICTLLAITPELWSLNLPHRTQILYATDISMIISMLYLQPGLKVIEAGTGSGSLSHSIIRTIYPTGHLYTFDFHEERVRLANQEFKDHKLDDYVTCSQRDVCENGFELTNHVDAVFLDLPNPWSAVSFAYAALKNTGTTRICCFSPCIEQVQKTVEALQLCNFIDIQTIECLNRPYEFKTIVIKSLNLNSNYQQTSDQIEVNVQEEDKNIADDDSNVQEEDKNIADDDSNVQENTLSDSPTNEGDNDNSKNNKLKSTDKVLTSATPLIRMPGHTGYLTFATKL